MYKKLVAIISLSLLCIVISKKIKFYLITNYQFTKSYNKIFNSTKKKNICVELQSDLDKATDDIKKNISLSVLNSNGELISVVNGQVPMIPASNQKLISTAYSLYRLGPNYKIRTLIKESDRGSLHIIGNGDPDLDIIHIKKFASSIYDYYTKNKLNSINIILHETKDLSWWPLGWTSNDKAEAYGAPITKLALKSNSDTFNSEKPISNFKYVLVDQLSNLNVPANVDISHSSVSNYRLKYRTIDYVESSPLYALLALANSESHNFTSEILLRNALNKWHLRNTNHLINWLRFLDVDVTGFSSYDASGLSRLNRVTTNGIVQLLWKMNNSSYSKYYSSSFSLYGVRGTLQNLNYDKYLSGHFLGKSGTLDNVKAISGIIDISEEPVYISIIFNGINYDQGIISSLLTIIASNNKCNY
ncbi:D-alanyl-D-alanine carboxypeptidase [Prochlorococcus sp. MIT 1223]|uniref:D-alanyl-D-alanine carboxypeptidase n=1 Tax=Prochlorococcus sp. MIT 1223 TaxID=3096217 RepID=UPI002A757DC7|nr:D-alanyl-D-alanine carboxypeptidase [Prochlorococcus sp. MIT 1223]